MPINASATKSGPGRRHAQGATKATPVVRSGAPLGFVQRTNPERAAKRRRIAAWGGRRQYLKTIKALRRAKQELSA